MTLDELLIDLGLAPKPSIVSRLRRWLLTPDARPLIIGRATEALYREMGHK